MSEKVNITLLLKPKWRSPEGVARLKQAAAALDLEITGAGEATVSAKVSEALCQSLFGTTLVRTRARPPGPSDFGAPGGHEAPARSEVPEALRDLVESVSIIPPARRLK